MLLLWGLGLMAVFFLLKSPVDNSPALKGVAGAASHLPCGRTRQVPTALCWAWPQVLLILEHWGCCCCAPVFCLPSMVSCSLPRNAKEMPAAVAEALQSVLQLEGGLSPSEAEEHLTALEQSQRFQSETWS